MIPTQSLKLNFMIIYFDQKTEKYQMITICWAV